MANKKPKGLLDNLTPLSPRQQGKFDAIRQTSGTVQHKCPKCSAWYETQKQQVEFTETFNCDCGERISVKIPKAETTKEFMLQKATNADMILLNDHNARLDTGMSVQEAIKRASAWWNKTAAPEMRRLRLKQKTPVGSSNKGMGGMFTSLDPSNKNYMPSFIIAGLEWDYLTKREKIIVTKTWHHFHVRKPDIIGGETDDYRLKLDKDKIQ